MPGGPRGLQNRRRRASGEVGSIPILSAEFLQRSTLDAQLSTLNSDIWALSVGRWTLSVFFFSIRKEVTSMSREQIRKLTSLSSCAG